MNVYRWRAALLKAFEAGLKPLVVGIFAKLLGAGFPEARFALELAALAGGIASLVAIARVVVDELADPHHAHRLLFVDAEGAGLVHEFARRALLWSAAMIPICLVWPKLGYRVEIEGDLWLIFKVGIAWLFLTRLMNKSRVVRLVSPESGSGYRMLHRMVEGIYTVLVAVLIFLLLLWGAGYAERAAWLARGLFFTVILAGLWAHGWTALDRSLVDAERRAKEAAEEDEGVELTEEEKRRRRAWTGQDVLRVGLKALLLLALGIALYFSWGGGVSGLRVLWSAYTASVSVGVVQVSLARLVEAGLVLVICLKVSDWLRKFLEERVFPNTPFDRGIIAAIDSTIYYGFLAVAGFRVLQAFGVGTENLAWFFGFLGIGFGFGMQQIVNNLASGVILMVERPIKPGDWVKVGSCEGEVTRISVRATVIRDNDQIETVVPNSELVGSAVTNWCYSTPVVRVHVTVGVAYGSDIKSVCDAMMSVARAHRLVLRRPTPEVRFLSFGESWYEFELLVWIQEPRQISRVKSDLNFGIEAEFRRRDIEIPFPQRELRLRAIDPRSIAQVVEVAQALGEKDAHPRGGAGSGKGGD